MSDPRDVILRPVVSEKSYALLDQGVYTFVVAPGRQQDRDPPRGRGDLRRQGRQRQHAQPAGQAQAQPQASRPSAAARHQARHRDPGPRPEHPYLRGLKLHAASQAQAHQRRPALPDRLRFRRRSRDPTGEEPPRPQAEHRGAQRLRPQDGPPSRWRPQAAVPHDRLQADQGRRAGHGGRHRVRPKPQRPDLPCCTTTTARSATSWPRPGWGSVTCCAAVRAPTSAPVTPSRCGSSRSARSSTTSS